MESSSSELKFRNGRMVDPREMEEMCFSTTIKDVPRYNAFNRCDEPYHYDVKKVVCPTGFLRNIDHSLDIAFYKEDSFLEIGVKLSLPPDSVLKSSDIYVGMVRVRIREKDRRGPEWDWETEVQEEGESEWGCNGYISTRYGDQNYTVITEAQLDIYVVRMIKPKPEGIAPADAGNVMVTLAKNMGQFFLSQEFSDATVECGDGTIIPVHRLILTGGSEYFGRMLRTGMQEANSGVIRIEEFSSECVMELLRFIYTGKPATINVELCLAADKYGLEELKVLCETHLAEVQGAVTVENALEVYEVGLLQKNRILQESAKKVISSNNKDFVDDAATSAFKELTSKYPEVMVHILQM